VLAALLVLGIVAAGAWMWPAGTLRVANDAPPAAEPPAAPPVAPLAATLPQDVSDTPAPPQTAAAPLTTLAPTVASNGQLTIRLLGHSMGP